MVVECVSDERTVLRMAGVAVTVEVPAIVMSRTDMSPAVGNDESYLSDGTFL